MKINKFAYIDNVIANLINLILFFSSKEISSYYKNHKQTNKQK